MLWETRHTQIDPKVLCHQLAVTRDALANHPESTARFGPRLRWSAVALILPELGEVRTHAGATCRTEGDPYRLFTRSELQI